MGIEVNDGDAKHYIRESTDVVNTKLSLVWSD